MRYILILFMSLCFYPLAEARRHALSSDTLTIAFTGDILLDRGVGQVIRYSGADHLFSPSVDSLFHTARLVVGNLECPVTEVATPVNKRFVFRGSPSALPALRRHGFTHLNLANNHTVDQGRRGLVDTDNWVRKNGMVPLGFGATATDAARPRLMADNPRPVYLLTSLRVMSENYVYMPQMPSVNEQSVKQLCDSVKALRHRVPEACIIVCLHWGVEHTLHPMPIQRFEAHSLVDAGADAVIGHHSHTAQDVETYKGKPICYSLGNFIFDQSRPINSRALVAMLRVSRRSVECKYVPINIRYCVPEVSVGIFFGRKAVNFVGNGRCLFLRPLLSLVCRQCFFFFLSLERGCLEFKPPFLCTYQE